MKAAIINQYGGTDAIQISGNHTNPEAGDQRVLVEVHSASLNRIDTIIRAGYMHQMFPVPMPAVLGGDFSGRVREVGPNVTNIKVGDEVFGQAGVLLGARVLWQKWQ